MRILHLAADIGPNATGRRLSTLVPRIEGHEQRVRVLKAKQFFSVNAEIIPMRSWFDLSAFKKLKSLFRSYQPDLLHCWGRRAAIIGSFAPASIRKLATYDEVGNWLTKRIPKLDLPPFAVEESLTDRETARRRFGLKATDLVILAADRFENAEPAKLAIWGLDLIKPNSPHWQLLLLGDGPARHRAELFNTNLCAGDDRVRFLGHRPVSDLLLAADFVWQTRTSGGKHFEAEAMAAGLPVVKASRAVDLASQTLALLDPARYRNAVRSQPKPAGMEDVLATLQQAYAIN